MVALADITFRKKNETVVRVERIDFDVFDTSSFATSTEGAEGWIFFLSLREVKYQDIQPATVSKEIY